MIMQMILPCQKIWVSSLKRTPDRPKFSKNSDLKKTQRSSFSLYFKITGWVSFSKVSLIRIQLTESLPKSHSSSVPGCRHINGRKCQYNPHFVSIPSIIIGTSSENIERNSNINVQFEVIVFQNVLD